MGEIGKWGRSEGYFFLVTTSVVSSSPHPPHLPHLPHLLLTRLLKIGWKTLILIQPDES